MEGEWRMDEERTFLTAQPRFARTSARLFFRSVFLVDVDAAASAIASLMAWVHSRTSSLLTAVNAYEAPYQRKGKRQKRASGLSAAANSKTSATSLLRMARSKPCAVTTHSRKSKEPFMWPSPRSADTFCAAAEMLRLCCCESLSFTNHINTWFRSTQ